LLRKYGCQEIARFAIPSDAADRSRNRELETIQRAISVARTENVEKVLLAVRWDDLPKRELACEQLKALPIAVELLPDRFIGPALAYAKLGANAKIQIELQRAPLSRLDLASKRVLDLALTAAGLVVLIPLFAIVSIAISLDSPGPIIFRQDRKGFNGENFTIYKFRTLRVLESGHELQQVKRNDKRLTRLGRVLRFTNFDELPQLINVIRGDMSLVGPRPHTVAHDNKYSELVENYAYRHHVKPGLTGWAQIHGFRGETAELAQMSERIALDIWYIDHWSFWLDCKILCRTLFLGLQSNAY
jgi:exopolysaccharide biosynthesis polyprenyl glycosylphosphotransferase